MVCVCISQIKRHISGTHRGLKYGSLKRIIVNSFLSNSDQLRCIDIVVMITFINRISIYLLKEKKHLQKIHPHMATVVSKELFNVICILGGGGGGFYSSGRSSTQFGGSMGRGGEGGGVGGRALNYNVVGGFGGGGGAFGNGGGGGGGGGYSGGSSGDNENDSCGGGGGSYNTGKNQQNECCYNTAGHGQVTITLT